MPRERIPAARFGQHGLGAGDRLLRQRAPRPGVDAQRDLGVEELEQRVEVPFSRRFKERVDDSALLGELDVRLGVRGLDAPTRAACELTHRLRSPPGDPGDLIERHREHVVQHEREALGGRERLEHDVQRDADAVRDERLVLRARLLADGDDRLGHP